MYNLYVTLAETIFTLKDNTYEKTSNHSIVSCHAVQFM